MQDISKILCVIDLDAEEQYALQRGAWLAKHLDAELESRDLLGLERQKGISWNQHYRIETAALEASGNARKELQPWIDRILKPKGRREIVERF